MAEKKKELVMVTDSTHRRPTKRLNEDQYHSLVDETETPQKKAKKLVPQQSDNISFSLPVLPHEIIVEIISRLPVKTLIQFRLPNLGFGRKSGSYSVFGFGYDSEIDDYKVVAVFCFQNKNSSVGFGYESIVKVCTLRTNCWRRTGSFGYGVPYDVSGKYVNCTLNWPVMSEGDSGLMWIIVSFDIKRETYKEVMQPDYGELVYDRTLGVLDGCLCVMCNYHAVRADFWVMKEYGVRESWIRLVTVPYLDYPGSLHLQYSVPYAIADNGEVLLEFKSSLVIYNPNYGTFKYPVINNSCSWVDAEVYIDSLVSPKVEI
ncbi:conserved hypothetical protein [Ricinus communis]|uniref:F-box associated beta-propeller type 1 domain-containing protein n=1 Tax=Ricinus communis TaxID=3988 RepID=B9RST5_RICCO|nr:conserved hypothetical protein [Ricinus communis]